MFKQHLKLDYVRMQISVHQCVYCLSQYLENILGEYEIFV